MKRLKVHFASQTVVRSWIKHSGLSNSIGKMCTFAFVMRIQIREISLSLSLSLSFFLSRARAPRVISLFKCINVCMFTAVANKAKLKSEFLATCFVRYASQQYQVLFILKKKKKINRRFSPAFDTLRFRIILLRPNKTPTKFRVDLFEMETEYFCKLMSLCLQSSIRENAFDVL